MQTFLPLESFEATARVLDYRRLGKQRLENFQILRVLLTPGQEGGWRNHPATRLWENNRFALLLYQEAIIGEWVSGRGYRDTLLMRTYDLFHQFGQDIDDSEAEMPWQVGNAAYHRSHQSNLIRKDSQYYGPMFPGVPDNLPYIWTKKEADAA